MKQYYDYTYDELVRQFRNCWRHRNEWNWYRAQCYLIIKLMREQRNALF